MKKIMLFIGAMVVLFSTESHAFSVKVQNQSDRHIEVHIEYVTVPGVPYLKQICANTDRFVLAPRGKKTRVVTNNSTNEGHDVGDERTIDIGVCAIKKITASIFNGPEWTNLSGSISTSNGTDGVTSATYQVVTGTRGKMENFRIRKCGDNSPCPTIALGNGCCG